MRLDFHGTHYINIVIIDYDMNKLYQVMYPGAYLPWGVLLMHYLFQFDVFHLLACVNYVGLAMATLTHMEHFNVPVLKWGRMLVISEVCLVLRLILFSTTRSSFVSVLSMSILWMVLYRLPDAQQMLLMNASVHSVLLLFLISVSTSIVQECASIVLICVMLYRKKMSFMYVDDDQMRLVLSDHFRLKIVEAYMIFLLEWSSSSLHWSSLLVVVVLSSAFQAYAYTSIVDVPENLHDFYHNIWRLDPGYPIPLNFMHARANCKLAKSVFKPHNI